MTRIHSDDIGTRDSGLGTRPGTFYRSGGIPSANGIPAESPVPMSPVLSQSAASW